ncbi:1-acyl-sn-glycerol-3-phosphate acyltransferase [Cytobacillus suaedae]|nr:1-acyl-sn-glycerol-3-phosphate acyltransferase [Cytobacillus suaedae]
MLRTIFWFLYFFGFLLYSIPTLNRLKKLDPSLSVQERDRKVHQLPQHWSKKLVEITKSQVKVKGTENLPEGPVLFVSNHQGNFDIPVLLGYVDKPMGFISKIEVKKLPIVPRWMEVMNCVFINRKDRRQAILSIKEGAEKLKKGHSLVIFPEGTRSKGGEVAEFKAGSLRLATDSGVPIVPIAINGTYKIMEHGGVFMRPANVQVNILPPIFDTENRNVKELAKELQNIIATNVSP